MRLPSLLQMASNLYRSQRQKDHVASGVGMSSNLWIPQHLRPARKLIKIVFYVNKQRDRVEVGAPEQYDIPPVLAKLGYEKVVCTTAHEVEIYSEKKRQQDLRDKDMKDEEREIVEAPIRAAIRQDLINRMRNSTDRLNKEFCAWALQQMDQQEKERKEKIESFQHVEAFEDGK